MSEEGLQPVPLSAAERARLDPRVNVARLEQFLARIPEAARTFALNACRRGPAPSWGLAGSLDPALDAAWREVWRADAESEPQVGAT